MAVLATIAPFGFEFDVPRFLRAYRALGCTTCQFYRNEEKPPSVGDALAAAVSAGVPFDSIHGVFGDHIDPSTPDRAHRHECVRIYENEGRLALELGGPMVVVHPSASIPAADRPTHAQAVGMQAARWPLLDDFLHRLADVGTRLGVTYLIENQPFNCALGHDPAALALHVAAIGSPNIRMCFDTGHANLTTSVVDAVMACGPVIEYIHVHDNDAKQDDHRLPYDGSIPWTVFSSCLRRLDLSAPRMVECFHPEERVEALFSTGFGARLREAVGL